MTAQRISDCAACVFDAYGTLFDTASAALRCRDALGDKADALAALWRSKQLEYSWLRSLMASHADFWQVTGDALDYTLAALGIDKPGLRGRLMDLFRDIDAFPDARRVLEALRRAQLPAAILSNGTPPMLAAAVSSAKLGEFIGHQLSVEEAGIYKPHRSVYEIAVKRLALPARRICFVSSNGWDAAGAAHFGFQAVWVNRKGAPRDLLPGIPAAEVASLDALPALLGL